MRDLDGRKAGPIRKGQPADVSLMPPAEECDFGDLDLDPQVLLDPPRPGR
jgi:hypothetical protein